MIKRVLIVGHGSIGKRHLKIVRSSLPNADIRIFRHQLDSEVPKLADGCFSTIEEVFDFSPEVSILANPAPFHIPIAKLLAERGCHLLIEKPLSENPYAVPALIAIANAKGIILQIGYNLRFMPSLIAFRDFVQRKLIGQVLSVRCEIGQYLPSWRPGSDYRHAVSSRSELGGGVLLELSHELDYLRWIFGEVMWVNAWTGHQSSLDIDVEDTAHLILGHNGRKSGEAPVTSLNMDFIRHDASRTCIAIGEMGSLRWQAETGKVEYLEAGSDIWTTVFEHVGERDDTYIAQWEHFVDSLNKKQMPLVTAEDGLAALKIVAAARKSASHQGVRIFNL